MVSFGQVQYLQNEICLIFCALFSYISSHNIHVGTSMWIFLLKLNLVVNGLNPGISVL